MDSDLDIPSRYGFLRRRQIPTALLTVHDAAAVGDLDHLERHVAAGKLQERESASSMTPLHAACEHGSLACVKFLIRHNADVAATDMYHVTPLHLACMNNYGSVAEELLQVQAPVGAKDAEGDLPIHWAATKGHCEVIELLLQHKSTLDAPNQLGWTPLHRAAFNGWRRAVQLLITKGASIKAKNKEGNTALHLACQANRLNVIELLLALGADRDVKNSLGQTPFDLCITITARELLQPGYVEPRQEQQATGQPLFKGPAATASMSTQPGEHPAPTTSQEGALSASGGGASGTRPLSRGDGPPSLLAPSKPGTPDVEWVAAHVANSSGAKRLAAPLPPIGSPATRGSTPGSEDFHEEMGDEGRQNLESMLQRRRPTSANKKFLAKYGLNKHNLFAPA